MQGKTNRVIGIRDNHYVDFDIDEALAMPYEFNKEVYRVAMELSI